MSEELTWMPAWGIRELIGKREVSPVEVIAHFLGRIEEHDPTLHAFLGGSRGDGIARGRPSTLSAGAETWGRCTASRSRSSRASLRRRTVPTAGADGRVGGAAPVTA